MVRIKQTTRKSANFAPNSLLKILKTKRSLQTACEPSSSNSKRPEEFFLDAKKSTTRGSVSTEGKLTSKASNKLHDEVQRPHRRCRPGATALKEIHHYQNTTDLIFNRLLFQRLIREICLRMKIDFRFQVATLEAIQVAAEDFLISYFKDLHLFTVHAKRVTLTPRDVQLARRLKRN